MDLAVEQVLRPRDLDEALDLLAAQPEARPLAGGTDLVVQLRAGRSRAAVLINLGALGLAGIDDRPDGALAIGAGTTMAAIACDPRIRTRHPALAAAAGLVGAWPIQCRATLGGNLANASPAADTVPALLVADARIELATSGARRQLPLDQFFRGPGATALDRGELILSIVLPPPPSGRVVERFAKVGPRPQQIIAVVSLAGRAVVVSGGRLTEVRLALGAVAPTPVRARRAEAVLERATPGPGTHRAAITAIQADIAPIDDVRAPARYRRLAAAVLLERFLEACRG